MKTDFDSKLEHLEEIINRCLCLFAKIDISESEPINLCRKMVYGELTTKDVQGDFELCLSINSGLGLLSTFEEQAEHFDFQDELEIINYFQALLKNLNSLLILYTNENVIGFHGFGDYGYSEYLDSSDFDRLASKNISSPTSLMSNKYFDDELRFKDDFECDYIDKNKAISWLKDRRHFKPIIEVDISLDNPNDIEFTTYEDPYLSIEKYINRLVEKNKKVEYYSNLLKSHNNNFYDLLNDNHAILELNELLSLDFLSFCSKVNDAKNIVIEKEKEKESIFLDFKNNKNISYIDVVDYIIKIGGYSHKNITETKYIKPMIIGENVIAIEKTKKVNIWLQKKICTTSLTSFNTTEYDKVEKNAHIYGRNSNLKKIPELAYDTLFKVKVLNGEEVINLISIITK
ncbi:hypothetical protein [Photobacterium kishitanii]|uniref:hypothetical protein n=1 Tax=Photobacterium kishitanii TaxID=318456 RepID=UPI000D1602B3|nr:hypothetical protein [Photobacterium kishitanii]PSW47045.1 hypothetical protein C0W66_20010 [Photobacterium kishitanii]